ncbi:hypothetical protein Fmac_021159 [Flemingia macrophylla]|uniref:Uncharacterized protein n=1 Tax=Flemingia macrophylla TaxID=520843 RepID=A0ABD1LW17_9FABA
MTAEARRVVEDMSSADKLKSLGEVFLRCGVLAQVLATEPSPELSALRLKMCESEKVTGEVLARNNELIEENKKVVAENANLRCQLGELKGVNKKLAEEREKAITQLRQLDKEFKDYKTWAMAEATRHHELGFNHAVRQAKRFCDLKGHEFDIGMDFYKGRYMSYDDMPEEDEPDEDVVPMYPPVLGVADDETQADNTYTEGGMAEGEHYIDIEGDEVVGPSEAPPDPTSTCRKKGVPAKKLRRSTLEKKSQGIQGSFLTRLNLQSKQGGMINFTLGWIVCQDNSQGDPKESMGAFSPDQFFIPSKRGVRNLTFSRELTRYVHCAKYHVKTLRRGGMHMHRRLGEKIANKNQDEFYFKMVRTKIIDGVHQQLSEANKYTEEELTLMKTQDIGYILQKFQNERKYENLFNPHGRCGGEEMDAVNAFGNFSSHRGLWWTEFSRIGAKLLAIWTRRLSGVKRDD